MAKDLKFLLVNQVFVSQFCLFDIFKVSIILITIPKFHLPIMPISKAIGIFKIPGFEPSYPKQKLV